MNEEAIWSGRVRFEVIGGWPEEEEADVWGVFATAEDAQRYIDEQTAQNPRLLLKINRHALTWDEWEREP